MRIAFDAREAVSDHPTGKGVWARGVFVECMKMGDVVGYVERVASCKLQAASSSLKEIRGRGFMWHWNVARDVIRSKPDVYIAPTSYIVPWLLGKCAPVGIVVHDLIAFNNEPHDRKARFIERLLLPRVLRTAQWIFVVSETTKKDLIERFSWVDHDRVVVVGAGRGVTSGKLQVAIDSTKIILSLGTLCPRKNQLRLIQAFNSLPNTIRQLSKLILIGGRGWDDQEIVDLASSSDFVEWKGYMEDEQLKAILAEVSVFAYPSLKEGFGIPVLDALAMGVPVLTSRGTSMEEIASCAAVYCDPADVESIAQGLERLLTDPHQSEILRRKGPERAKEFSWKKTAQKVLNAIS